MYLVTPDPERGIVAAPRAPEDLTAETEQALTARGFIWDDRIEAHVRLTPASEATSTAAAVAAELRSLGHYVITPAAVALAQLPT
ncbi:hypothetical protein OG613_46965 (plasmid) [Streptomyces sp. NBC_00015]|uniref:hypothetical protein n=1 Tax=Streptomyces sp. NBC_00015 TaxID=2903611 RepID=UPI002F90D85B